MKRICKNVGCNRKVKRKYGRECNTCTSKKYRKKNPIMAAYHSTKSKAKNRKIPFNITYKQFEFWCRVNRYLELRGKGPDDYCIDRNNPSREIGYTFENMVLRTNRENGIKSAEDKKKLWEERNPKPGWLKEVEEEAIKSQPLPTDEPPF